MNSGRSNGDEILQFITRNTCNSILHPDENQSSFPLINLNAKQLLAGPSSEVDPMIAWTLVPQPFAQ
jgi:hypothetical protein